MQTKRDNMVDNWNPQDYDGLSDPSIDRMAREKSIKPIVIFEDYRKQWDKKKALVANCKNRKQLLECYDDELRFLNIFKEPVKKSIEAHKFDVFSGSSKSGQDVQEILTEIDKRVMELQDLKKNLSNRKSNGFFNELVTGIKLRKILNDFIR